jgi:hypothetical protein
MMSRRGEDHESGANGLRLAVTMQVIDASSPQTEPEALVELGHEPIGPYS